MELNEVLPGVFSIPKIDLPEEVWFIRDTEDEDGGQCLMHICERSEDAIMSVHQQSRTEPAYLVTTGIMYWDYIAGAYRCSRCSEEYSSEEELELVWEDGIGTGYEGYA